MTSIADVFAQHCSRDELAYQVDAEGRPVFPPRVGPFEWKVSGGAGTVHATTTAHPRGGEPYDISLIELDEGFRMMSRVRGGGAPIGARVRVAFEDGVPVFDTA